MRLSHSNYSDEDLFRSEDDWERMSCALEEDDMRIQEAEEKQEEQDGDFSASQQSNFSSEYTNSQEYSLSQRTEPVWGSQHTEPVYGSQHTEPVYGSQNSTGCNETDNADDGTTDQGPSADEEDPPGNGWKLEDIGLSVHKLHLIVKYYREAWQTSGNFIGMEVRNWSRVVAILYELTPRQAEAVKDFVIKNELRNRDVNDEEMELLAQDDLQRRL
ncbi:hypothetical protein C2E23DRAFT_163551 [Lenzites betulinus]|nr:hypothetical protein C2E23DRAFT_163551 [Lenzites betulinus]